MIEVAKNLLLVNDEDEYIELPNWSKFYINLGYWAAIQEENTKKITVLSLPTRAFSSPLIALGALSNYIENFHHSADSDQNYFMNTLYPLENGSTLKKNLRNGKDQIYKKVDSYEIEKCRVCGENDFEIKGYESNNTTVYWTGCNANLYREIIPTDANIKLNKKSQKFTQHSEVQHMWFDLFKKYGDKTINFYSQNSIECLIIGSQKILKEELQEEIFAVETDIEYQLGNLQDIIRTNDHENESRIYKTDIWSDRKYESLKEKPKLIIFDGTKAFIEFHTGLLRDPKTKLSNWVIILDRRENKTKYEDAVNNFNDRFRNRPIQNLKSNFLEYMDSIEIPFGLEILSFNYKV